MELRKSNRRAFLRDASRLAATAALAGAREHVFQVGRELGLSFS